jgi:hypothetical protein
MGFNSAFKESNWHLISHGSVNEDNKSTGKSSGFSWHILNTESDIKTSPFHLKACLVKIQYKCEVCIIICL